MNVLIQMAAVEAHFNPAHAAAKPLLKITK
jgi:hypothetical protein